MSAFLFDRLHVGMARVLDLRQAQHGLTAGNLANAATPGYRARYIPFDRILANAVGRGDELSMRRTNERHVMAPGANPDSPEIEEIEPPPWAADQNSVNAEREMVRLTENTVMYESVATGLSRRMAMLRYAAGNGNS